jgi:hypothetical protein
MTHRQALAAAAAKIVYKVRQCPASFQVLVNVCMDMVRCAVEQRVF